jgi:uncharacterized surface protein with fasciclin (FAS1) repeats
MKKLTMLLAMAMVIFSVNVNAGNTDKNETATKNIVELAVSTDILSTLVAAVKAGGLVETLNGDGPFTVFAPTNAAFEKLPAGVLEKLLKPENKAALQKVLTYHVIPAQVKSTDLSDGQMATTVEGNKIEVSLDGQKVMINNAQVVKADIMATNGVVHVIDTVILPPDLTL